VSSEHLPRTVLWPSYSTTAAAVQPPLQVTTAQQPAAQHIQLFEPAEPSEYLAAPATRILVQPQLTIASAAAATAVTVATDTIHGMAKPTSKQQATALIKIEPAHTVSKPIFTAKWLFSSALSGEPRFKCQPRDRLLWQIFRVFPQFIQVNSGIVPHLGHYHIISHNLQFIIH
jgi:hypothetical protein